MNYFALGTAAHRDDMDNPIMISLSHAAFERVAKSKKVMRGRSFLTVDGKDVPFNRVVPSKYKMYKAHEKNDADKKHKIRNRFLLCEVP